VTSQGTGGSGASKNPQGAEAFFELGTIIKGASNNQQIAEVL
jgi:hypothetical protein